jgi:hypothetical protein
MFYAYPAEMYAAAAGGGLTGLAIAIAPLAIVGTAYVAAKLCRRPARAGLALAASGLLTAGGYLADHAGDLGKGAGKAALKHVGQLWSYTVAALGGKVTTLAGNAAVLAAYPWVLPLVLGLLAAVVFVAVIGVKHQWWTWGQILKLALSTAFAFLAGAAVAHLLGTLVPAKEVIGPFSPDLVRQR